MQMKQAISKPGSNCSSMQYLPLQQFRHTTLKGLVGVVVSVLINHNTLSKVRSMFQSSQKNVNQWWTTKQLQPTVSFECTHLHCFRFDLDWVWLNWHHYSPIIIWNQVWPWLDMSKYSAVWKGHNGFDPEHTHLQTDWTQYPIAHYPIAVEPVTQRKNTSVDRAYWSTTENKSACVNQLSTVFLINTIFDIRLTDSGHWQMEIGHTWPLYMNIFAHFLW